jgi:hypothetical protein
MKMRTFILGKASLSGQFIKIMIFYENVFIAENRKATGAQTSETICLMAMLSHKNQGETKRPPAKRSLKNSSGRIYTGL